MRFARRVAALGVAAFSRMDRARKELESRGLEVVNLGIGSPDFPPAPHIIAALRDGVADGGNYGYVLTEGLENLKEALASWYQRCFGVDLDPREEVLSLMGSQDGLAHVFLALIEPGDVALVGDPGYPVYSAGVILAGGEVYPMPLTRENGFLPRFEDIPRIVAERARVMVLNYPNNPVAAVAELDFFEEAVAFARRHDLVILHDLAYAELAFDGYRPPSLLQVPGARDVAVEFYSVSKTYNMAGCRLGFVSGNAEVIAALTAIKSNIDYGVFRPVQLAGIAALSGPQDGVHENAARYARRRDVLVDGLARAGWFMEKPRATMFVWAPLPGGYSSAEDFALELLERTGVVSVPGTAFGHGGEGYVRFALVAGEDTLRRVVDRIASTYSFSD